MYQERICPENYTQHVVKRGDTLWQLARTYGVSVQSIRNANPGIDADNLREGSILCIPTAGTQPQVGTAQSACPEGSITYTVKPGDTFWKLSQTYGVSLQSLIDANPGVPVNNLQVGSVICIPTAVKKKPAPPPATPVYCPEGSISYTVKPGDTFWKLSRIYGVSLQSLVDANPGVPANNLQVGSTICIPAAAKTPAPPQTSPAKTAACPEGSVSYTVKPGDTLWQLSQLYGVSVQRILDANPGVNADNLQVGSTICIPAAETAPEELPEAVRPEEPLPEETLPEPVPEPTRPQREPRTCPKGTFPYTIEAGDTLWQLALNFGVSVQKIIDLNPDINVNSPQVGATICIPIVEEKPETAPADEDQFVYMVKECETLHSIARKFYVSPDSILARNPDINSRNIQPGTLLYIPLNCCASNSFRYVVSAGDNLYRIANRFNVCPASIVAANPNVDFNNLVRCQIICIPSR